MRVVESENLHAGLPSLLLRFERILRVDDVAVSSAPREEIRSPPHLTDLSRVPLHPKQEAADLGRVALDGVRGDSVEQVFRELQRG